MRVKAPVCIDQPVNELGCTGKKRTFKTVPDNIPAIDVPVMRIPCYLAGIEELEKDWIIVDLLK